MGVISKGFAYKRSVVMRIKGLLLTLTLRAMGCSIGRGLRAAGWPVFRLYPSGNIKIGNNLTLGKDVTFEIAPGANLQIGNNVYLSDRVVLSTLTEINIGDRVSIAENTGIRGSFHQLKASELAVAQPSDSAPVRIDLGVGIGANTTILMGVHLPEGAIVGANSVVNGKIKYESNGIYAGSPARLLKFRE